MERAGKDVVEGAGVEAHEPSEGRFRRGGLMPWIAALAGGVGGLGALEYLRGRYQHGSVFMPDEEPDGGWDPTDVIDSEDVWFQAPDGPELHGWWIGRPRAVGTALYCHGSSGSITHRVGVFQALGTARLNVFAFDYRGYGQSSGTPTEEGLYADVRAAHDHLTRRLGQSPGEIVLFGHSLGGAVALDAAVDREVAGLVVEASFTDIKDMARLHHPQIHWIARNGFRSVEKVQRLTVPKLFIHGTADETVPFEIGHRLYEAAAEPKELLVVEGAGHNDIHLHGGAAYRRRIKRFTRRCLR